MLVSLQRHKFKLRTVAVGVGYCIWQPHERTRSWVVAGLGKIWPQITFFRSADCRGAKSRTSSSRVVRNGNVVRANGFLANFQIANSHTDWALYVKSSARSSAYRVSEATRCTFMPSRGASLSRSLWPQLAILLRTDQLRHHTLIIWTSLVYISCFVCINLPTAVRSLRVPICRSRRL
jgi:hypothetical protein